MYNKIFTKILDSSIWLEPTPTRIIWITLIAAMDETGYAHFSAIGNLSSRARTTDAEAEEAIKILTNPDTNSSDPEFDGRRIERVPGGFMVLNAEKYRDIVKRAVQQQRTKERVRDFRARKKDAEKQGKEDENTPPVKKYTYSGTDIATADWIFQLIKLLNPNQKEPNYEQWANDIRLMREMDKHTYVEIRDLFAWANKDDFWKQNILSPGKLRGKWDELTIKRKGQTQGGVGGQRDFTKSTVPLPRFEKQLEAWANKHGVKIGRHDSYDDLYRKCVAFERDELKDRNEG